MPKKKLKHYDPDLKLSTKFVSTPKPFKPLPWAMHVGKDHETNTQMVTLEYYIGEKSFYLTVRIAMEMIHNMSMAERVECYNLLLLEGLRTQGILDESEIPESIIPFKLK